MGKGLQYIKAKGNLAEMSFGVDRNWEVLRQENISLRGFIGN